MARCYWINRRLQATFLLAFSSGLPFALSNSTLQAWLTETGVDVETIGLFGLVGLPYLFKFLWAPLMDRFVLPILDRRRGWIVAAQLLLSLLLLQISYLNPHSDTLWLAILSLGLAFMSASQDIVIDAYRTDILPATERGLGAALTSAGYRIAVIVSGAGALTLAYYFNWSLCYRFMALLMLLCVLMSVLAPKVAADIRAPSSLRQAIVEPWRDLLARNKAIIILLLVATYKIGDVLALSLSTTFLLRGVGFSLLDVASMNKILGLSASIVGMFVGGVLLSRWRLIKGLWIFGLAQALSNLTFYWLALAGKVYWLLALSVFTENFCGGLGNSAYFALLMGLCVPRFSASQYALLSALFASTRVLIAPLAGPIVVYLGFSGLFLLSFIISLPPLGLLYPLRRVLLALDQ